MTQAQFLYELIDGMAVPPNADGLVNHPDPEERARARTLAIELAERFHPLTGRAFAARYPA